MKDSESDPDELGEEESFQLCNSVPSAYFVNVCSAVLTSHAEGAQQDSTQAMLETISCILFAASKDSESQCFRFGFLHSKSAELADLIGVLISEHGSIHSAHLASRAHLPEYVDYKSSFQLGHGKGKRKAGKRT